MQYDNMSWWAGSPTAPFAESGYGRPTYAEIGIIVGV